MLGTTTRKTDMSPNDDIVENEDEEEDILAIVRDFDKLCFEYGDRDAILLYHDEEEEDDEKEAAPSQSTAISYFEIQEYSKLVAAQLYHRFGQPDYILLEVSVGSVVCEAVGTLALCTGVGFGVPSTGHRTTRGCGRAVNHPRYSLSFFVLRWSSQHTGRERGNSTFDCGPCCVCE